MAVAIAPIVVAVVAALAGVFGGIWIASRLGIDTRSLSRTMKRHREERRTLLTRGERVFVRGYMLLGIVALAGIPLVVYGRHGLRTAGIVLLLVALLIMAIPISPFLRARVRRREGQQRAEIGNRRAQS